MNKSIGIMALVLMGMTLVLANQNPPNSRIAHYFKVVQQKLRKLLDGNYLLEYGLVQSLERSVAEAKRQMKPSYIDAINAEYGGNGFPTTLDEWAFSPDSYIWKYMLWIPNEKGSAWQAADGFNYKVRDLIDHFYYLINSPVVYPFIQPQEDTAFQNWLIEYIKVNEMFLDSSDSLTPETLQSFIDDKGYKIERFIKNKNSWKTWNQIFYRRFNDTDFKGLTPLMPISNPHDNRVVVSPTECTFKAAFPIEENGEIKAIRVKGRKIANVDDLLGLSLYSNSFHGGTFVHYYLSPFDYHRYHVPVRGKVVQVTDIPGFTYLDVKIKDGRYYAPDDATGGYQFKQSRGVIIIDTKYYLDKDGIQQVDEYGPNNIGMVAIIPIGMGQVSGVGVNTALSGQIVEKGWEFGMFKFGGSDIIMLFQQPPARLQFEKKHFHLGEKSITVTGCMDKYDWCNIVSRGDGCSKSNVNNVCQVSCGACSRGYDNECVDKYRTCSRAAERGGCSISHVRKECPVSCGTCSPGA